MATEPLMWTHVVELRLKDGRIDSMPFTVEYAARNFVLFIPEMQLAGHPEFVDIVGARVKSIEVHSG